MSGVNAHAILRQPEVLPGGRVVKDCWTRDRLFSADLIMEGHPMLTRAVSQVINPTLAKHLGFGRNIKHSLLLPVLRSLVFQHAGVLLGSKAVHAAVHYVAACSQTLILCDWALQARTGVQIEMLTQHPSLSYLQDHIVQGTAILPAAAFLELCLAAGHSALPKQPLAVTNASIMSPLALTAALHTITCSISHTDSSCRVATHTTHFAASLTTIPGHASLQGSSPQITRGSPSLALIAQEEMSNVGVAATDAGLVLHPSAVATVATDAVEDISSYWLHPAALDSCLQLGASVPEHSLDSSQGSSFVPVAAAAFYTPEKQTSRQPLYTSASPGTGSSPNATMRNHAIITGNSSIQGWLQGLQAKAVRSTNLDATTASPPIAESLYEVVMLTDAPARASADAYGDPNGVTPGSRRRLRRDLLGVADALQFMQLAAAKHAPQLSLQIPAVGPAAPAYSSNMAMTAAASKGLLQAFAQEHPSVDAASISDSSITGHATLSTSMDQSHPTTNAFGLSLVSNTVQRPSLVSSTVHAMWSPYQLRSQPRGAITSLLPLPYSQHKPAAGMVELAVHAVGVNFRDVLNVLGMYPGDPGNPGSDCAGIVIAVGAGVTHLQPGMAVFGLAGGSLGTHVQVWHKPSSSGPSACHLLSPFTLLCNVRAS